MNKYLFIGILLLFVNYFCVNCVRFDVDIVNFKSIIEPNEIFKNSSLRVKKFNRTVTVFTGEFELLSQLDDKYDINVDLFYSASNNNQYSKTPFKIAKSDFCSFSNSTYREYAMEDLMPTSDFPRGDILCPWEKRMYTIDNYIVQLDKIPFGKEGMWRVDVNVWKGADVVCAIQFTIKLTQRYSL